MSLRFPAPLDTARFLQEYWQRAALYLPEALEPLASLSAADLAGLACETNIESRLVLSPPNEWQLRHGPFSEHDFQTLPATGWTLLVQDVDKFIPEVASILATFAFLPQWRIDDIMISYAAPGGTVGPHVDDYDVFLIQASGSRTWEIGADSNNFVPGMPLRLLADFEPQQSWTLEPGDVLYLPPGVAHHGYSDSECVTWSVGLRTPSVAELLLSRAEFQASQISGRYGDTDLRPEEARDGLISPEAVRRALVQLQVNDNIDAAVAWFGCLITENKHWLIPEAQEAEEFDRRWNGDDQLQKHPAVRMARSEFPDAGFLFADGKRYSLSRADAGLAGLLCRGESVSSNDVPHAGDLLRQLHLDGKLYWGDDG